MTRTCVSTARQAGPKYSAHGVHGKSRVTVVRASLLLRCDLRCHNAVLPTYEALHRLGNGHGQDELYHPLSIVPWRHAHSFVLVDFLMKLADSLFIAQSYLVEVLQAENSGGLPRALS